MIRHTILFKAKSHVSKQAIDNIVVSLWTLKKYIPGIISVVGGECEFHEASPVRNFSHGISIDFKDQQSLDNFFDDAITHPVKNRIVDATEEGDKGIIGFNFRG